MTNMIEARNLKKQFVSGDETIVIFEDLNLEVREGEFVVLTGRSGSGKSTLLYLLGLLDMPDAGDVVIDGLIGSSLDSSARTDLRLEHFGYVFQDYGLMAEMSAIDNVMLPLIMRGESKARATEIARTALERVGLGQHLYRKPAKLSGGQQQRVSIARAIAHNPSYILADEPTANLDSINAMQILDVFNEIHRSGTTVVLVTHEKESLARADRVLSIEHGRLTPLK